MGETHLTVLCVCGIMKGAYFHSTELGFVFFSFFFLGLSACDRQEMLHPILDL